MICWHKLHCFVILIQKIRYIAKNCFVEMQTSPVMRSSERLRRRQQTPFTMPRREDILDEIPSTSSPQKSLAGLQRRRIVNDFMKG